MTIPLRLAILMDWANFVESSKSVVTLLIPATPMLKDYEVQP